MWIQNTEYNNYSEPYEVSDIKTEVNRILLKNIKSVPAPYDQKIKNNLNFSSCPGVDQDWQKAIQLYNQHNFHHHYIEVYDEKPKWFLQPMPFKSQWELLLIAFLAIITYPFRKIYSWFKK